MAGRAKRTERNNRLEEAMALLIQNQASFLAELAESQRQTAKRFGRIEQMLLEYKRILDEHTLMLQEHSRVLNEHTRVLNDHTLMLNDHTRLLNDHARILEALPEAVRRRIGFHPPQEQHLT